MLYPTLNENPLMMNPISEQLLNLSQQILKIGIQTFIAGQKFQNYFFIPLGDFKNISMQLNTLINSQNKDEFQR